MKILTVLVALVLSFFILIFVGQLVFKIYFNYPQKINYGVTFSTEYTSSLGLDWKDTYIKILDDLKVRNLRLLTYWDELEPKIDEMDFSKIDFMLSEAEKNHAKVILVLGAKQPRWPECHIPTWAKSLNVYDREQKLLEFINTVVTRYKDNNSIWAYQIENEPFLHAFGKGCDSPDSNFLKQEIEVVRSLSGKKIILTDSGELGFWVVPMQLSDIFGTTLYRDVYNRFFGYAKYPLPPFLYNLKAIFIRNIFAKHNNRTIISELQSEPWSSDGLLKLSLDQQIKLFPMDKFKNNINFGRETGFDEQYLWGVEWWYFMAEFGHPEYIRFAKTLF